MSVKLSVLLFALFLMLMGLGQLLVLPPFEGYDETGHYSLIVQTAQEGGFPSRETAFLAQEITAYGQYAPMPYAVMKPYQENGGMTYPHFFERTDMVSSYAGAFAVPLVEALYHAGPKRNWQIQHPPLYYLLMGAVMSAVRDLSFLDRFFALRFVSFFLACAGLVIGMAGTVRFADAVHRPFLVLAFFLYPVLLPEVIPAFARLGNDSLCALIFGCAWVLMQRDLAGKGSGMGTFALGVLLGAGLVTKGFFLVLVGGWGLFQLYRLWLVRSHKEQALRVLRSSVLPALVPIALGFGWYLKEYVQTGALIGHLEYKIASEHGGAFWRDLWSHTTFLAPFNSIFSFLMTWTWAGTASLVRLPETAMFTLIAAPLWLLVRGVRVQEHPPVSSSPWGLSFFILIPFFLGLLHHGIVLQGIDPQGGTPGWYLHIFMAPVALLMAYGLKVVWTARLCRVLLACLLTYALGFQLVALWANMAATSGCAVIDTNKMIHFLSDYACLTSVPKVLDHISLWGRPELALALIGLSLALSLFALIRSWSQIPHIRKDFNGHR